MMGGKRFTDVERQMKAAMIAGGIANPIGKNLRYAAIQLEKGAMVSSIRDGSTFYWPGDNLRFFSGESYYRHHYHPHVMMLLVDGEVKTLNTKEALAVILKWKEEAKNGTT